MLSKFRSWNSEQLNPAHQRGRRVRGENCLVVQYLGVIHERSQKMRCPARGNGVICQGMGAREGRLLASYWLLRTNAGLWLAETCPSQWQGGVRNAGWDINCVLALQSNTNTKWKQQTHITLIQEQENRSIGHRLLARLFVRDTGAVSQVKWIHFDICFKIRYLNDKIAFVLYSLKIFLLNFTQFYSLASATNTTQKWWQTWHQ